MEGDAILPSYGLDPETARAAKVGQGDGISWQNDVPNWHKTEKPEELFQSGLKLNKNSNLKPGHSFLLFPNGVNVYG